MSLRIQKYRHAVFQRVHKERSDLKSNFLRKNLKKLTSLLNIIFGLKVL